MAVVKIYTIQDLQNMDNDLDGEYELANHIDAAATETWNAGAGFSPIGLGVDYFRGIFHGEEFEIRNLHINRPATNEVGLFSVTRGSDVRNVRLVDASIVGRYCTGSLAGWIFGQPDPCTIINCGASGSVFSSHDEVGGLVGSAYDAFIEDCFSSCRVETGDSHADIGGLVGYLYWEGEGRILRCRSIGDIFGTGYCGGLVGYSRGYSISQSFSLSDVVEVMDVASGTFGGLVGYVYGGSLLDSYARGKVKSIHSSGAIVGGLIGYARGACTLDNSFSTGLLEVADEVGSNVGGLIGLQHTTPITVTESFWDKDTSGRATSDGGVGKTTVEMKQEQTFLDASWDLDTIWGVSVGINGGYPELQWVEPPVIPPVPPDPLPPVRLKITPYTLPYRSLKIYTGRRI